MTPKANRETIKPLWPSRVYCMVPLFHWVQNSSNSSLPLAAEGFVNCDESRRRFALRQPILSLQHRPLGIKHGQKSETPY